MALLKRKILAGRVDLLATEIMGFTLEPFHKEILTFSMDVLDTRGDGLLLAPRGFGKSTIGTVAFSVFLILINPNIRILVGSSTAGKAEAFLREIKSQFEQNEKIKQLFGDQYNPEKWKSTEIFVADRTKIAKEATLSGHGWSGAVVSKHYDVQIIDDLVNEDNARTKNQREKLKDWFYMSLDPTLEPHGFRISIGTRYHPDDIYQHFMDTAAAEEDIEDEDEDETPVGEKKAKPLEVKILAAIQNEGTDQESSLWESKFSLKKLKRKQRSMGKVRFAAQFQNQTELMKGKIFKEHDIQHYRPEEIDIRNLRIFQGVDLAAGKNSNNDFFALTTKAYDIANQNAYTLDCVHGRYGFRDQMVVILWKAGKTLKEIQKIIGWYELTFAHIMELFKGQSKSSRRQYKNVVGIGIESVAYQKVLPETLLDMTIDVPIIKIDQSVDKETRMLMYSPRFENHKEFFPDNKSLDPLLSEMLMFPDDEHDDLIDSHEICNKTAAKFLGFGDPFGDEDDAEVSATVIK